MNINPFISYCLTLPEATEDIKWMLIENTDVLPQ
jgi:hypothetical protein